MIFLSFSFSFVFGPKGIVFLNRKKTTEAGKAVYCSENAE